MGSYGSVSYSYSDIAFSNAGLSLTTDARIFSSLSSVSIVDWLADYPGVNCETETATFGVTVGTVITLDAPTDFPTTWAYTVNQGVDSLAFDDYTCSSTCGTITYTAYLFGETDFGDLSLYLSFDDTNRAAEHDKCAFKSTSGKLLDSYRSNRGLRCYSKLCTNN